MHILIEYKFLINSDIRKEEKKENFKNIIWYFLKESISI